MGELDEPAARRPAAIGDVVLGATLAEVIGRGPNGTVFRATGEDGRTVAVKVFDAARVPPADAETFRRGVDTLERVGELDERGAVALVRPSAIDEDGLAFVLDYYDNGNLAGISSLGWDVRRTVAFFAAICGAVRELHALGVLHRALKPTNVLVDGDLQPVLTDAGMRALPEAQKALDAADATYSAPEELAPETTSGPTADIYGLGRLLWFLLLGRDPDDSADELAMLEKVKPLGLVRIVRRATAFDPALRYQSVEALEAELARWELGEAVGVGAAEVDHGRASYATVSLVEPLPKRTEVRSAAEPEPERDQPRALAGMLERTVASMGLLAAAGAGAFLAATPAPSPRSAELFALMASGGLALATFFMRAHPRYPLASRLVVAVAVFGVLGMLELERLAALRWKATLANGTLDERAAVARTLSRRGVKDLRGAELSKADLSGADLGSANLGRANLSGANLTGANLAEADLTGAKLAGANLRRADLSESQAARAVGFREAHCDGFTTLPGGWTCAGGHPSLPTAQD